MKNNEDFIYLTAIKANDILNIGIISRVKC